MEEIDALYIRLFRGVISATPSQVSIHHGAIRRVLFRGDQKTIPMHPVTAEKAENRYTPNNKGVFLHKVSC
jgi:hypothetical protein